MKRVLHFFIPSCVTGALLVAALTAAPQSNPKFDQLAALVSQKMTEYNIPGVAFGMVKDGAVTVRGFGVTNIDNPQPITPDTIFALASISKTLTTTAILRLVEQGKIDLNAPVRKYLPGFTLQDESAASSVTIWHLLTHTPGWEGQLTPADKGVDTLAAFVDTMKNLPQLAPPGTVWSYNNAGFSVAGRVIEVVTGQNINDALRTLVFQPIGLTRAFTRLEDVASFPFSVAHQQRGGATVVTRPLMKSSSVTAGGVSMSLRDVLTYGSFHLGDGTGADGKPVLSKASLELMRTPRVHKAGTDDDMGLGWHLRTVGGVVTAAHGGTLGHCLLLELVPSRHLAFAILTNHSDGWKLVQDIERATLQTMEGLSVTPTQALAHRGVNETMPDVPLLASQPDPAPYLGMYRRPPSGSNTVSVQNGQLTLDRNAIAFYGPDRAIVTSGNSKGNPIEFVRKADGTIGWVRYVGRIARKDQ
ncbi:MAG TPA: serine hydrolase domain-containing protein [Vicinamibacterales bacterium]|nr:serine hydrolase domain-containing protein [Vicinamibacterales bacterium]